jgi:F0F1-type ATP synthase membrane subunit b/b'
MIIPFKKFMIGGLDNKIEEIKKNINLSLEGFTTAEKKLNEASKSTKDIDFKIKEILENAKVESKEISRVIIEKNQSIINSKEKNSIDRIKQIELAAVQSIKSQASIKLNEIIINYFEKMPEEKRKIILKNKIEELKII